MCLRGKCVLSYQIKVQHRSMRSVLLNMFFRSSISLFIVYSICLVLRVLCRSFLFWVCFYLFLFLGVLLHKDSFYFLGCSTFITVWTLLWILTLNIWNGPLLPLMTFDLNSIYLLHHNLKACCLIISIFLVYFCPSLHFKPSWVTLF